MKFKLLTALFTTAILYTHACADSVLGRDVDQAHSNTMYSLYVKYLPVSYVTAYDETEYDAPVLEAGWSQAVATYTRLYWMLNVYGRVVMVDDSEYGDGRVNYFGGGVGTSIVHKTFFGKNKSYELGLGIGLDFNQDIEVTDATGTKTAAGEDTYGDGNTAVDPFYIEPTIGIKYEMFSFTVGYKFFYTGVGTPTVALKYYF